MKNFVTSVCKGANWCAGLMVGGITNCSMYSVWMNAARKKGVESNFGMHIAGLGISGLIGTIAGSAVTCALNKAVDETLNKEKEDNNE